MTDRRKAIRERVLALLDASDAGGSENWRDGDPAYWVGVAEGAYDAEGKADALRSEVSQLRETLVSRHGGEPLALLAELDEARAEVSRLIGEVARFKEREEHFAKALRVADGGQYRADWDGAIERVVRERDEARAEVERSRSSDEAVARLINGLVEAGDLVFGHVQRIDWNAAAANMARECWLESRALLSGDDTAKHYPEDAAALARVASPPPGGPEHEHSEDCRGVDHARLPRVASQDGEGR